MRKKSNLGTIAEPEKRSIWHKLNDQIKTHRKTFVLYVILRVLVIIVMALQFINGNYEDVFLCGLTLVLFLLPSFVEVNFHIQLPDTLELIVLLFIFAAEILGEISSFYTFFPFWDSMLHTINGFLAAAIGFSMVDILNRNEKFTFSLSPAYMALVAFCFSMTIGVLWEFFEFGMDFFFGFDMQKDFVVHQINSVLLNPSGLNSPVHVDIESVIVNGQDWTELYGGYVDIGIIDTMKDLFVNFIGAAVFSVIGYLYVRSRGKSKFVSNFILQVDDKTREDNKTAVSGEIADGASKTQNDIENGDTKDGGK